MKVFQMTVNFSAAALGFIIVSVATFFLMGYLFKQPTYYTWPPANTPVGLPVAILFLLVGIGIIILSMRRAQREGAVLTVEEECRFNRLEVELGNIRRELDAGIRTLPCKIQDVIDRLPCQQVGEKIAEVAKVVQELKSK